jgi:enoyl-CoA hydratase/carnithine racemase
VSYENLRLEQSEGIARITIDRQKLLNALNGRRSTSSRTPSTP